MNNASLLSCFTLSIISLFSIAQDTSLRKLREIIIPVKPASVTTDRLGNIYLIGEEQLIKLSEEGYLQHKRQLKIEGLSLLDAWNPLRIWVHRRTNNINQVELLDQQLMNAEEPFAPDAAFALNPLLIAPGTNNFTYWILDSDQSLKQINTQTNSVLSETNPIIFSDEPKIIHIRAYQGYIFLMDTNGAIIIINRMGQKLRIIDTGGARSFGVLGEDIYFVNKDKLMFENLYSDTHYEVLLPEKADFVIATDERLMLIHEKTLKVFSFKPKN